MNSPIIFLEKTKKVLEIVSQIHVNTISAVSQQLRKDSFCFEIVQVISPFFDIYELLLENTLLSTSSI